jgi:type II secretory pathway pseudopilin PulG
MTIPTSARRRPHPSEEGYILLAVICMLALVMIALSVALPRISKEIQRDRELETMHRGKQYIRAVQLYYKKFSAYPPNVDALVKSNQIRFLRRKYIDPTTGKDEWKPIHFGQNKVPTAMGFFGQPLAGSTVAGVGPSGGNGVNGASTIGGSLNSSFGSTTASGSTSTLGSTTASGSATGNPGDQSSTGSDLGGQTFGGAGIIGFSPGSPKQSILVYKKKNHYNEWEFVYDPLADRVTVSGSSGPGGQSAATMSSGIGSTTGSGTFGSGSFGSGTSSGGNPTSSPTTTPN